MSLINEEYVDELLLKFQTTVKSLSEDVDASDADSDNAQELAGMKLWDLSSSAEGVSTLLDRNIVEKCSSIISDRGVEDRIVELASGILANIAVHKQHRCVLANHNQLLINIRDIYLDCIDPAVLFELTRIYSSLLRPVDIAESSSSSEEDGNKATSFLHDMLCTILSKSCWIIHNCLDINLLGQTSEFILLLFYYEYPLFKCLINDKDCKLVQGMAEMSAHFLNEFQSLPQGSKEAGYVIDLLDILTDELEESNSSLTCLYGALPSLADCIITSSLPIVIVYKSVVSLSRLHKDARNSIEMPIDNELAISLLKLLQDKSMLSSVGNEVMELLEYQLQIEKEKQEITKTDKDDNDQLLLGTIIAQHADDVNKVLDSRDDPINAPRLVSLALGRCAGAKRRAHDSHCE